ncbi:hypothetical protein ROLI_039360 [Roseobacter fucihabitans]|uniref:4-vinyl reductase 4VR domain-containing protein n=1 Tax=Roseobacter fucihabitans TaxID=1537242 RepID=A0ABZ2BXP0_9RHOB|nr:bacteriochlorophyll 4-vinyl reductase [Roseobacter litoralis]MBC6964961.1 V4R domain protein [Roseobacter litoralis]
MAAAAPSLDTLAANPEAKVGPNAVTQVAAALRALGGETLAVQVFKSSGLGDILITPPEKMVAQDIAARLHDGLRIALPPGTARGIARDAGHRTADYLLANRIPRPAQWVMKTLPARWAGRLLLRAMAANAWTYAGSGRVHVTPGNPCRLEIIDNPLAQPQCHWHVAVFEHLFRSLVAQNAKVTHPACCAQGAPACRFEISLS